MGIETPATGGGWANHRLLIGGVYFPGVTEFEVSVKRTTEMHRGQGAEVIAIGTGDVEYSASVTMDEREYVKLEALAPNGDVTQLVLTFVSVQNINGVVKTRRCNYARISEAKLTKKTGDTRTLVTLPLVIAKIEVV